MEEDQQTQIDYSSLDHAVELSIESNELITKVAHTYTAPDSWKDRVSDAITKASGSWTFIGLLLIGIAGWMVFLKELDPFPYILLNLIISVVCVCQSPFILMSQWRKEEKDDDRDQHSYAINLKNELQIQQILRQQEEIINLLSDRPKGQKGK